ARGNPARGLEARHPAHRAGDAHPETLGRRIARHAAVHHCPHNALAKIVGKRHPRRLLRAAKIMNQNSSDSGIPQRFTSLGYRSKLAFDAPLFNGLYRSPKLNCPPWWGSHGARLMAFRAFYYIYERRLLRQIRLRPSPRHVGVILDGNRSTGVLWASPILGRSTAWAPRSSTTCSTGAPNSPSRPSPSGCSRQTTCSDLLKRSLVSLGRSKRRWPRSHPTRRFIVGACACALLASSPLSLPQRWQRSNRQNKRRAPMTPWSSTSPLLTVGVRRSSMRFAPACARWHPRARRCPRRSSVSRRMRSRDTSTRPGRPIRTSSYAPAARFAFQDSCCGKALTANSISRTSTGPPFDAWISCARSAPIRGGSDGSDAERRSGRLSADRRNQRPTKGQDRRRHQ